MCEAGGDMQVYTQRKLCEVVLRFRERPGCLARLLTNLLLLAQGYPPLILISANRQRYYAALAATDPAPLTQLFNETMRGFLDLKVPLTEQEAQRLKWSV